MSTWQVQSAKQRFSELIRAAETGEPQFITRHGEAVAVVIDISEYNASHEGPKPTFKEYLTSGPSITDLEFPPREIEPDQAAGLFLE